MICRRRGRAAGGGLEMTDRTLQNFVNGKFTDASDGRTSDVIDPSTGEVYAHAPISSSQDVDAAMQAAAAAFEGWRDATPSERSLASSVAIFSTS